MKWMVAVDSSMNAEVAFNAACGMMDASDTLYLISVAEYLVFYSGFSAQPVMDMNRSAEKAARRLLIKYCHEATRRKIRHCSILGLGDPREVICQAVEEKGIDILVLGRKGLSNVERLFVGSVSEHCVNNASCTVYVVKYDEEKQIRASLKGGFEKKRIGQAPPDVTTAKQFLDQTQVCEIIPGRRVHYVEDTDRLDAAFKSLTDNDIHSVPVYSNTKGCFIGNIDMVDIMIHALKVLSESDVASGTEKVLAQEKFLEKSCGDIAVQSAQRNPFVPIDHSVTLKAAIDQMSANHLHRLAIINPGKEGANAVEGILSQSTVLSAVLRHLSLFNLASKTIGELGLGTKAVATVKKSQHVKDAFQLMESKNISGVGVVNDEGVLEGNVSATDFRIISYSNNVFGYLYLTVENFVGLMPERDVPGPLAVKANATVEELLMKFAGAHVHRLYVVDDAAKPIGIITQGDVIELLSKFAEHN